MEAKNTVAEWFHLYGHEIYNYLIYSTWSKDVDDLLQEVFLRAYKGFHQFQGNSHPKTWLYTIARNVIADAKRKEKSHNTKLQILQQSYNIFPNRQSTPEEIYHFNDRTRRLIACINLLKQNYKEVIILRGIKEFSVKETAQILGWSEGKVNVTFHRALHKLKLKLQEREGMNDE